MTNEIETGCCPRFNPEPWDEKEITWQDKLFLKDHVRGFLHIPLNFGKVMTKNMKRIEESDALASEPLVLSDDKSLWRTDIYINVSKEVPGAEVGRISGTFLTKVFEGSYGNMRNWMKEMHSYVKSRGRQIEKMYSFYTTCPRCAKIYGENYTVLLAKV